MTLQLKYSSFYAPSFFQGITVLKGQKDFNQGEIDVPSSFVR